ncbi:hypothetical protein ACQKP8_24250 [Photobacterium alginatilyticum]|uniref:hypothetical protein n=1 Tax=Photobacterium alginatilyticum TaxID=1775171 RepID=UPI0040678579
MPSQLNDCVQAASSTDFSGWLSLLITIVGWPVVYWLARQTSKKLEVNKCIDQLDSASLKLRERALTVSDNFSMADYHAMVALYNYVNLCCKRIEEIDNSKKRPKDTLRNLKKVSTDELFIEGQKDHAISKILALQVTLNYEYSKSV